MLKSSLDFWQQITRNKGYKWSTSKELLNNIASNEVFIQPTFRKPARARKPAENVNTAVKNYSRDEIQQYVLASAEEIFINAEKEYIVPDASVTRDLEGDYFQRIERYLKLEKHFGINIFRKIRHINDVIDYIYNQQKIDIN